MAVRPCLKRFLKESYEATIKMVKQIVPISKTLPPALQVIQNHLDEEATETWAKHEQTECTCWETMSGATFRMGASWASNSPGDVANLADIEDTQY